MKYLQTLLLVSVLILGWINNANAQVPSGFLSSDLITGAALNANDRSVVILIHGWTNETSQNAPSNAFFGPDGAALDWAALVSALKTRLNGTGTKLLLYHWENDASTGPAFDPDLIQGYGNASVAAAHAKQNGIKLSGLLHKPDPNQAALNLRNVHFIAHSAGSWAAREALKIILQKNPYVVVQMTLLDPFIPDASLGFTTGLSTNLMSAQMNCQIEFIDLRTITLMM